MGHACTRGYMGGGGDKPYFKYLGRSTKRGIPFLGTRIYGRREGVLT